MPYCRIVANCESLSKVMQPVKSRCLLVRVPAPSNQQIQGILKSISNRESFNLPEQLSGNIARFSKRNLRRSIMMLQTAKLKHDKLTDTTYISVPEYETFTVEIAQDVFSE